MKRVGLVAALVAAFCLAGWVALAVLSTLAPENGALELVSQPFAAMIVEPAAVAWATFLLLAADLLLPVPGSVVISGAAMVIGWPLAALAGTAGLLAGNLAGYWLCRLAGRKAFERFVTPEEAGKFGKWLDRWGPAALVVSRLVPVMAETLSCMAGLARMHFGRFLGGLVVGTVPFALFFACVGHYLGRAENGPGWALAIALALPAAGWLAFAALARRGQD